MQRFILAPIVFMLGLGFMKYRLQITNFTGRLDFAEKWFGAAGTYTFWRLFGLLLCILAALWLFNFLPQRTILDS